MGAKLQVFLVRLFRVFPAMIGKLWEPKAYISMALMMFLDTIGYLAGTDVSQFIIIRLLITFLIVGYINLHLPKCLNNFLVEGRSS